MIRAYNSSDRGAILEIFNLNAPKYFDQAEVKDLEAFLDDHGDSYLTIEHQSKIAGGTGYQITDNNTVGEIRWILFHPDCAGHGLGRQSLEHCIAIFRKTPTIKKMVARTSQLAYVFFEKLGFNLVRTERDFWGEGLDLYLMEMGL